MRNPGFDAKPQCLSLQCPLKTQDPVNVRRVLGCLRCFGKCDFCFIDLWPALHRPIMLLFELYFLLGGDPPKTAC